ncbi:hypothetical protein [Halothiobacillus sp.]|uniref:hypothetical protein n=1 Tax=Halothiobacillus sp. TaxID=1891311 RepID=UPI0026291204|nr:hypothetical protein [Halothiobacillus sp.]MDD4967656.1 hypothetical protein [Halothiobacillus sp.]
MSSYPDSLIDALWCLLPFSYLDSMTHLSPRDQLVTALAGLGFSSSHIEHLSTQNGNNTLHFAICNPEKNLANTYNINNLKIGTARALLLSWYSTQQ